VEREYFHQAYSSKILVWCRNSFIIDDSAFIGSFECRWCVRFVSSF
jgi:hypothetical protein